MATFEFKVPVTRDFSNWGSQLVETLKVSFSKISQQINDNNVREEIQDLTTTIQNSIVSITAVKSTADEALQLARDNAVTIKSLKDDLKSMESTCNDLKDENTVLKQRSDDLEIYSRKNNLVIRGIAENDNESDDQCSAAVKLFFKEQLKLDDTDVAQIKFIRCHRLGFKKNVPNQAHQKEFSRQIIVRFVNFSDRQAVYRASFQLRNNKQYSVQENYPGNIGYRRRKLHPIYSFAKKQNEYEKNTFLKGDRLHIGDKMFTVENIDTLPAAIHPRKLCTKSNDDVIVSGGTLSEFSFLSNYAPCDIEYQSVKYVNLEHAYQHARAVHFNDRTTAAKILTTKNPAEAKRLGYRVSGFDAATWNGIKEKLMLKLLRIKFKPMSDMARKLQDTGNKLLAESGKESYFSCGMPLTHPDILDSLKWKSNKLGELQMKIRNELNEL